MGGWLDGVYQDGLDGVCQSGLALPCPRAGAEQEVLGIFQLPLGLSAVEQCLTSVHMVLPSPP